MMTSRWEELYSSKRKEACIDEELKTIQNEIHSSLNVRDSEEIEELRYLEPNLSKSLFVRRHSHDATDFVCDSEICFDVGDCDEEAHAADLLLKEIDDMIKEEEDSEIMVLQDSFLNDGATCMNDFLIDSNSLIVDSDLESASSNVIAKAKQINEKDDILHEALLFQEKINETFRHFSKRTLKRMFKVWHHGTIQHKKLVETKLNSFNKNKVNLLLDKVFTSWWILERNAHAKAMNYNVQRQRNQLEILFCEWANEIWRQMDNRKVRLRIKRNCMLPLSSLQFLL